MTGSGKTTILYKLALDEVVVTQPTVGSNCEEVVQGNMRFQIWDLSGAESMRGAWSTYC
jgi:ADP-ribosylation factor-like protein 5B